MPEKQNPEEIVQRVAQSDEPESLSAPEKSGIVWLKEAHATGENLITEMNQLAAQLQQAESQGKRDDARALMDQIAEKSLAKW